jgi:FKBP-type peptidyl-prolyl cis-trans isomerase
MRTKLFIAALTGTLLFTITPLMSQSASQQGAQFLQENAKKDGVKTTASGLQYKIITPGTGKQPKATDTVVVNYRGKLLNGTEFDSSYKRNQPATFPLNRVIPAWTEGVQLLKEGGKVILYCPSNLAYGSSGTPGGPIGPDETLIFEVELLKVQ